jgi:hypothetical protein
MSARERCSFATLAQEIALKLLGNQIPDLLSLGAAAES